MLKLEIYIAARQACFRSMEISLNLLTQLLVDAQLVKLFNIGDTYSHLNLNIFHHLKLEIVNE